MAKPTAKLFVQSIHPEACCDYYESMRSAGKPCYFIRKNGVPGRGLQAGVALSGIFRTPKRAWRDAAELLAGAIELVKGARS